MTIGGFIIGMSFAAFAFLGIWALGNVGVDKHKKSPKPSDDKCER